MSFIQIRNLGHEYRPSVVLERINIDIESGEFCTLVGASGCGKSTFLRILVGQEMPTSGDIMLNQKPLRSEPDPDRGIVFQQYSVYPHLTVLNNVLLGLELKQARWSGRLFGRRRKAAISEAETMLNAVGLYVDRNKYPTALSGGMRQRLAIAQSLVLKPRVLLLDEPFGALDPGIRIDMQRLLLTLWQEHDITVLMVTHDLKEAFELGTRVLVFDKIRHDEQEPNAFGATITYDLPADRANEQTLVQTVTNNDKDTRRIHDVQPAIPKTEQSVWPGR